MASTALFTGTKKVRPPGGIAVFEELRKACAQAAADSCGVGYQSCATKKMN